VSGHSFAFVVDDGSWEKVAEVQEDDPAAEVLVQGIKLTS